MGSQVGRWSFFRVENENVLDMTIYDVFFYEEDLSQSEREAWKRKANEVLQDVNKMFPYSSSNLKYECPLCKENSVINDFLGDMVEAKCPKCGGKFSPAAGHLEILRALYVRDN